MGVGHRLTGHNAVANRAQELGLKLEPTVLRALTQEVKRRGDERPFTTEELDELLRSWVPA
jgi:isopropylmalate/homocitrate/citramalate synthase